MKKNIFYLALSVLFSACTFAQNPTYEARLMNDTLYAPNMYEFDIYVKNTGNVPFEAYGLQVSLLLNDMIRNGGTLNVVYVAETSEMRPVQIPTNPIATTLVGEQTVVQLAGIIPSRPGEGTVISNEGNGTRLGRFRMYTTAPSFSNSSLDLVWNFDQEKYNYATKFHAYVNGLPKDVTIQSNHFNELYFEHLSWWLSIETPIYEARLMNDLQTAPNEYEFDIFVKLNDTQQFEVFGLQVCLLIDDTVRNGGTLSAIYIPGSSEMLPAQIPNDPNLMTVFGGKRVFKLAGKIPTGPGSGTIISNNGNGTRLGRFKISTTAKKFAKFPPNIVWNFDQIKYNYATKFYAYTETITGEFRGRDITAKAKHLDELTNVPFR